MAKFPSADDRCCEGHDDRESGPDEGWIRLSAYTFCSQSCVINRMARYQNALMAIIRRHYAHDGTYSPSEDLEIAREAIGEDGARYWLNGVRLTRKEWDAEADRLRAEARSGK